MDVLTAWAVANPAMARLLWVLVLMLVSVLLWLCFCCYSWNQSSSPSLERYLAGTCCPQSSSSAPLWRPPHHNLITAGGMLFFFLFSVSFQSSVTSTGALPFQGKSGWSFHGFGCVGSESTSWLKLLLGCSLKALWRKRSGSLPGFNIIKTFF